MAPSSSPWSIAIFAARETPSLLANCVRAAITASAGRKAVVNVLINGNPQLAAQFSDLAKQLDSSTATLRLWSIATPDKAHTWNEFVYRIWDGNSLSFFIDGYAQVRPDALAAMEHRLAATPHALAATGVPTSGRSAAKMREQMLREGGFHGNLFGISQEGMQRIRTTGFKLPLGIYRNDSLIGAAIMFSFDPANHRWDPSRVAVAPTATWHIDGIEKLNWKNIATQFKRILRQAQGELENRAVREHMAIKKLPPQMLPRTAAEMVEQWLACQPAEARALFRKRPLCHYAIRKIRSRRDWSSTETAPSLVLEKD